MIEQTTKEDAMQIEYTEAVKVAADSIVKLRQSDVYRLIDWYPQLDGFAAWIKEQRPDLASEVDACVEECYGPLSA